MTDKTPAMPELPEPELGYIETDKSRQPAFSARQMRAALQAQPAEVSDAELLDAYNSIDPCNESPQDRLIRRLRAILALRPAQQAVPMTRAEVAEAHAKAPYTSNDSFYSIFSCGIRAAEAHHGITAQGAQEGK